jgi:hypothetical protein
MCTLLNKALRHENVWTDEAVSSHAINIDVDKLFYPGNRATSIQ